MASKVPSLLKPLKAYALVDRNRGNRIQGGNYRCEIYWTRAMALKAKCEMYPDCVVVGVIVEAERGKHE